VLLDGGLALWMHELHQKYGPIVRYAPNELSFIGSEVWKDVYGYRTSFPKSSIFYGPDPYGNPPGLIRADTVSHARQRKLVSHAFSDKALREQETLLKGYAQMLIKQLTKASHSEVDIVQYYNFTTFDIMADLTFGEPLHLLEDGKYSSWVSTFFGYIKFGAISSVMRQWELLDRAKHYLMPASIKKGRNDHIMYSSEKVKKRLELKTERPDIWTYILKHGTDEKGELKGLFPSEMHSNGALFMIAGTETTATLLSGLTYYLLKDPYRFKRLQKEVQDAFSSVADISMTRLAQLEFLGACIEEGLRLYPPVAAGLPREAPKGGAKVAGQWIPQGVCSDINDGRSYY